MRSGNVLHDKIKDREISDQTGVVINPREAAAFAGLRYISDDQPGLRRKRCGKGFTYILPSG
jgi:DNA topoisomerase IB